MPITLGTNIASLNAQRRLASATDKLGSVFQRLSTGQRITRASDDAAGLAVASTLNADTRIYNQGVRNLNDGISALSIADQAMGELTGIVTRQKELAEQAANGIYSSQQRSALDNEAQALNQEYTRILQTTKFNGSALIDGSSTGFTLQGGVGSDGIMTAQYFTQAAGSSSTSDSGTTTDTNFNFTNGLGGDLIKVGVVIADWNGDGIQDLAAISVSLDGTVAGQDAQNVAYNVDIVLGQTNGSFSFSAQSGMQPVDIPPTIDANGYIFGATLTAGKIDIGSDGDQDLQLRLRISYSPDGLGITNNAQTEYETFTNNSSGGTLNMDLNNNDTTVTTAPNTLKLTGTYTSVADFNGDGTADDLVVTASGYTIKVHNMTTSTTAGSIDDLAQASFSLTTQSGAQSALTAFSSQLTEISTARGKIGSALSRISVANNVLGVSAQNFAAAEGRIRSADVGADSAELTRLSILQNAGAAVLAQANTGPNIALQLLKN